MKDIRTLLSEATINEGKNELTNDDLLAILCMVVCILDDSRLYSHEVRHAKLKPTMNDGQIYDYAKFLVDDPRAQAVFNFRQSY